MNEPQLRRNGWSAVIVTAMVIVTLLAVLVVGIGRTLGLLV